MADIVAPSPFRALDANGDPVPGAQLFVFLTGTDTALTVYTDEAASVPHESPILAADSGTFAAIFSNGGALPKVDVKDPTTGASLPGYPIDPCPVVPLESGGASQITFTPTDEIPQTNVQSAIVGVRTEIFGAKTGSGASFVSGTAGPDDNLAKWNADGDSVDGGVAVSTDDTLATDSDALLPTEQAVKAYVDARAPGLVTDLEQTLDDDATVSLTWTGTPRAVTVELEKVLPATDGATLQMRVSSDGGSTWDSGASDYSWFFSLVSPGSTALAPSSSTSAAEIILTNNVGNASGELGASGELRIYRPGASARTSVNGQVQAETTSGTYSIGLLSARRLTDSAVNAVQFFFSTGNLTSGDIRARIEY